MAGKKAATTTAAPSTPEVPGAGAGTTAVEDAWDSPADHGIEHEPPAAQSPAEPEGSKTEPETSASAEAAGVAELAEAKAEIERLKDQLATAQQAAKPKREPLKLDFPETANLEPEVATTLKTFVDQLNAREVEREAEHAAAMAKIGSLESDNQLSKEERALTKMFDALPNDHYRAVYEGEDAQDNITATAKKMAFLRTAYKAAGGKVPSERALFSEAAKILFAEKADEIRAKGGRPRKDRTISPATKPSNGTIEHGRKAAFTAWNRFAREKNLPVPLVSDADLSDDDRGY